MLTNEKVQSAQFHLVAESWVLVFHILSHFDGSQGDFNNTETVLMVVATDVLFPLIGLKTRKFLMICKKLSQFLPLHMPEESSESFAIDYD